MCISCGRAFDIGPEDAPLVQRQQHPPRETASVLARVAPRVVPLLFLVGWTGIASAFVVIGWYNDFLPFLGMSLIFVGIGIFAIIKSITAIAKELTSPGS